MRRLVSSLTAAAGLALALAVGSGGTASAACVSVVELHGVEYTATTFAHRPGQAFQITGGVRPACKEARVPRRSVSLAALKGVPQRIAVITHNDPFTAYLAPGFLLALKSHPLHRYAASAPVTALFGCTTRTEVHGSLRRQPGAAGTRFALVVEGRNVDVDVRASTVVRTPLLAGMPYLAKGQRLTVKGCRSASGRRIAAYSIRRLPPIS